MDIKTLYNLLSQDVCSNLRAHGRKDCINMLFDRARPLKLQPNCPETRNYMKFKCLYRNKMTPSPKSYETSHQQPYLHTQKNDQDHAFLTCTALFTNNLIQYLKWFAKTTRYSPKCTNTPAQHLQILHIMKITKEHWCKQRFRKIDIKTFKNSVCVCVGVKWLFFITDRLE